MRYCTIRPVTPNTAYTQPGWPRIEFGIVSTVVGDLVQQDALQSRLAGDADTITRQERAYVIQ